MTKAINSARQLAIKELFLECLALESASDRQQRLRLAEDADPDLAFEVQSLLAAVSAGQPIEKIFGFASKPEQELTLDSAPSALKPDNRARTPEIERPGSQIGPYKLLEQIGEGGMGSVYLAQQVEPIKRKVALKVIKPGMDTSQVVARFEAERQALALMDHPNIARVLDAGTTQLGRPYFVMELVRGVPITDYSSEHKLSTESKLQLFMDICYGVQHAHQKGIIHRDLKPTNVLVTLHDGRPVIKIIDFGIAKAMNQDLTDKTCFTGFAQLIGTPMYMSPEQAELSGLDVDTRSDVYSLGIILYELLTGSPPFDRDTLKKKSIEEVRRMIREINPPKPSQRLSTLRAQADSTRKDVIQEDTKRLHLELKGELDWVVMRALEKERDRRYESASAFAADIKRFLDDEPVQACPPSMAYRLQKIYRRHRHLMLTAALLICTLVSATAVSTRYAYVAEESRRESDAERQKTIVEKRHTEDALQIAEQRRERAEQLEAYAAAQNERIERELYKADIRLADSDFRSGNINRLQRKLLAHCPKVHTQSDVTDYRGWEWYYLLGASHPEILSMNALGNDQVDWSHDGSKIASVGRGTMAHIWDAASGALIHKFDLRTSWNRGGVWSPNGQKLAWSVQGNEAGVRIWDSKTDNVRTLYWDPDGQINGNNIFCVQWSPDGQQLAATSAKGVLRIWNSDRDQPIREIDAKIKNIWGIAWSPDSQLVALASHVTPSGVSVWNASTGERVVHLAAKRKFRTVAFARECDFLIAGETNGNCCLFKVDDWSEHSSFPAHTKPIMDIAVSPTQRVFATASSDNSMSCWSLPDARPLATYLHTGSVESVAWDNEGKKLVTACLGDRVKVWAYPPASKSHRWHWNADTADASTPSVIAQPTRAESAIISDLLEGPDIDTKIRVALGDGKTIPSSEAIRSYVELGFKNLAPRPKALRTLKSSDNSKTLMTTIWSPDGRAALTIPAAGNQKIALWTAGTSGPRSMSLPRNQFSDISWSNDGSRFAIAHLRNFDAGVVTVSNVADGRVIHQLVHRAPNLTRVAWSPNGTRIVSGSSAGTVTVWDALTGLLLANSDISQSAIKRLTYSPDGSRIAASSTNGQVKILDGESAEELIHLNEGDRVFIDLVWSVDGQQLFGLDETRQITVWDARPGYAYVANGRSRLDQENDSQSEAYEARLQQVRQARALRESGRVDEAIQLASQGLAEDPDSKPLLFVRAAAYHELKDFNRALADANRLVELDPNYLLARQLQLRAEMPVLQGRHEEEPIVLEIGHAGTKYELCKLLAVRASPHVNRNHDVKAVEELEAYIATAEPEILNDLAWFYASCSDPRFRDTVKGLELAQRAVAKSPENAAFCNTLGVLQFRAGDWQVSIDTLAKAEALVPGESTGYNYFFIAMAHWKLGHKQEAQSYYDQAVQWMESHTAPQDGLMLIRSEADVLMDHVNANAPAKSAQ